MKAPIVLCSAALLLAACAGAGAHTAATPHTTPDPGAPHINPYLASLAFAQCMREHGVAHPNPDRSGDFHLTLAQERRMRASATPKEHEAAETSCFHFLKGTVSTKPLSRAAMHAALEPLRDLKRCMHGYGYEFGKPLVRNLSRGRAMFGFDSAAQPSPRNARERERFGTAQHTCEKRVNLARRIDAIIKADRGEGY